MRWLDVLILAPIFAGTPAAAREPSPTPASPTLACAAPGGPQVEVRAVNERGDFHLSDGREARLVGLDTARDVLPEAVWRGHLAAIRGLVAGERFHVGEAGGTDRWGRVRATLAPVMEPGDAREGVPLHEILVESGLARLWPFEGGEACLAALATVEEGARAARLGLWREPGARLIEGGEGEALGALRGRLAVVDGRVRSLGHGAGGRIYLNLGPGRGAASVSVPRRALKTLENAGLSPSSLVEKRVRVRGIVGGTQGPLVEVTHPRQIEVIGGPK